MRKLKILPEPIRYPTGAPLVEVLETEVGKLSFWENHLEG